MIPVLQPDDPAAPLVEGRPLPASDLVSGPYWSALAGGRLLYQQCPACGHRQLYPRALCIRCSSAPTWAEASGSGEVHTFTVVRQNFVEPFRKLQPYVVAIVELDEGPRLMGNLIDVDTAAVHIGMKVGCIAVKVADTVGLPFWRPRADEPVLGATV
jgi:uncharacterized OB-fold protein